MVWSLCYYGSIGDAALLKFLETKEVEPNADEDTRDQVYTEISRRKMTNLVNEQFCLG